jgi:DNA-binding HxlR family transcriptional regulator
MDNQDLSDGPCPIARGLHRIGDTWSMLILRNAGGGQTRFDEFQKTLGIAPNILSRRLSSLTAKGMLVRHRYNDRPPRYEYLLSQAGKDFLPVLYALGAWGRQHFSDGNISGLVDMASGKPVVPVVIDRISGSLIAQMEVCIAPVPSADHD